MPSVRSATRRLAPAVKALSPRLFWRRKYRILQRLGESRSDIQLAVSLCDPNRISLDIGADVGQFTIAMLGSSRSVIAFEPRPAQARELASMFDAARVPVRVEAIALSDTAGVGTMRVVESEPGRSTIDTTNVLSDVDNSGIRSIEVPVRRLDDLDLHDIGMIKIDVEGHELAVLRGATHTLARDRPAIMVEAEQRHYPNAVAEITELLRQSGYSGYFDLEGVRRPIDDFDPREHQDPSNAGDRENDWAPRGVYVNNFVFIPQDV